MFFLHRTLPPFYVSEFIVQSAYSIPFSSYNAVVPSATVITLKSFVILDFESISNNIFSTFSPADIGLL